MRRALATIAPRLFKTPRFYFSTVKPSLAKMSFKKTESLGMWRPLRYNFSSGNKQTITMPALSPTMNTGKIVKWNKKVGDKVNAGDLLCEVETDKATVDFETNSEGYLAKIVKGEGESAEVGEQVAILVENEADIKSVGSDEGSKKEKKSEDKPKKEGKEEKKDAEETDKKDKSEKKDQKSESKKQQSKKEQKQSEKQGKQQKEPKQKQDKQDNQTKQSSQPARSPGDRIIASPLAKSVAVQKNVSLHGIKGSGPGGRIIEQDVQQASQKSSEKPKQSSESKQAKKSEEPQAPKKAGKFSAPENPFEEIPITGMRKTIATRLVESKTTIPHYYISVDIIMDNIDKLRNQINTNATENGVKITVNDFVLKAAGLALRDFPAVNVQWGEKAIKQFKYSDVSMAVSTESGLITPIIFRAETKGLIQIAKETKQLAKKARENKLQPAEFIGGTISVSNAGMYGLSQMVSIINAPQAIILGVAKSEKKILFDDKSTNPEKPYKIADVMTVWASVDHRLVDGALAAQYLGRVKKYLETPINMIL